MTDPVVAPKTTPKAITIKLLAYEVAEQHKLSNKQGLVLMEDLVELITAHLKKGERVKLAGFGIWVVRNVRLAWAAIRRLASPSISRPAKK